MEYREEKIDTLHKYIKYQQNVREDEKKTKLQFKGTYITSYGKKLFQHFCNHKKRKDITIQYFDTSRDELEPLYLHSEQTDNFSLFGIIKVFPEMKELTLSNLDLMI